MKKAFVPIVFFVLTVVSLSGQSSEQLSVRRFGFYIASNDGGPGRQRLLYADDDVYTISRTMSDLGGVSSLDEISLFDPDASDLDAAVDQLRNAVQSARDARRTEVFFYYSGHSDERGIMLGDDLYPYGRLRDKLDSLEADVIVAVLDSCASGAFTRDKGGVRRAPFLIDDSSQMEGHAFLTSSSADEVSQESDSIGGSFFTHYLVSGLRGAADTTRDGRVTLNEIYQHTYSETLARTEDTLGGPQHPNYDIRLTGAGDLVLTDLSSPSASLILAGEMSGRVSLRNSDGRLVAELNKRFEEPLTMALPPGDYALSLQTERTRYSGSVSLQRGVPRTVNASDLSRVRPEITQFRGEAESVPETVPFAFSVVPGVSFPDTETAMVNFQAGAPIASAWGVEGMQAGAVLAMAEAGVDGWQGAFVGSSSGGPVSGVQTSGVYNMADGAISGAQVAMVFNSSQSRVNGAQVAGVYNTANGSLEGAQVAGVFNRSSGSAQGLQLAGIWNGSRGELSGLQMAGFYNRAEEVHGIQMGLVNVSENSSGLLVGLVNYSEDMRAFPLGLINVSRSGIRDLDFRWEQGGRKYLAIKTGNRYYYNRFIIGFKDWDFVNNPESLVFGFGAGLRFTLRPIYFELDLDWRTAVEDYAGYSNMQESFENFLAVPTLSLTAGLGPRFGFYSGLGFSMKPPWVERESVLLQSGGRVNLNPDGTWVGTFKWYAGFHL